MMVGVFGRRFIRPSLFAMKDAYSSEIPEVRQVRDFRAERIGQKWFISFRDAETGKHETAVTDILERI